MAKQRISYVDLAQMDADMRKEMERCQREGTPRPESSAVRAHVKACFWFFANSWRDLFKNGVLQHPVKELCRLYVSRAVTWPPGCYPVFGGMPPDTASRTSIRPGFGPTGCRFETERSPWCSAWASSSICLAPRSGPRSRNRRESSAPEGSSRWSSTIRRAGSSKTPETIRSGTDTSARAATTAR